MYAKCTECNWTSWVEKKGNAPRACPECKSKVIVTENR